MTITRKSHHPAQTATVIPLKPSMYRHRPSHRTRVSCAFRKSKNFAFTVEMAAAVFGVEGSQYGSVVFENRRRGGNGGRCVSRERFVETEDGFPQYISAFFHRGRKPMSSPTQKLFVGRIRGKRCL